MIRACEEIERKCNKVMRKACEDRKDWKVVGDDYEHLGEWLWRDVYNALPADKRGDVLNMSPVLPKEWKDCQWAHFCRNRYGKLSEMYGDMYIPSPEATDTGTYCPIDADGQFDFRFGFVRVGGYKREMPRDFMYFDSLYDAQPMLHGFWNPLHDSVWVLRCNHDLFLEIDNPPVQCECGGHGICFKCRATTSDMAIICDVYWEVLENGDTFCDWQHPFKVVVDDMSQERFLVEVFGEKCRSAKDVPLEDTMLMFLCKGMSHEWQVDKAVEMHGWFK